MSAHARARASPLADGACKQASQQVAHFEWSGSVPAASGGDVDHTTVSQHANLLRDYKQPACTYAESVGVCCIGGYSTVHWVWPRMPLTQTPGRGVCLISSNSATSTRSFRILDLDTGMLTSRRAVVSRLVTDPVPSPDGRRR